MNKLLISYDLITPGKYYNPIIEYIKSFPRYAKPLESLWIVKTNRDCKSVRDDLSNLVDSNDKILVVDITGCAAAWYNIPKENWIKNNQ